MKKHLIILFLAALFSQCTNQAVLSQLYNSRLKLVLMSTYESNDPYAQQDLYIADTLFTEADGTGTDLEGTTYFGEDDRTTFSQYFDIAEVRLATGSGLPSGNDPNDYFEFFARDRELLCSETSALDGKVLETCIENNGVQKLKELNSTGYNFPSVDVPRNIYQHVAVYFRRMVTYPSVNYDDQKAFSTENRASFDNREVQGTDAEALYQFLPNATNTNPLMFPLENTSLNLNIPHPDEGKRFIIEVRFFTHNLWMKHVIKGGVTGNFSTFVGPSDWAADHDYDDDASSGQLGGNVIVTARLYKPDEIGAIMVSNLGATTVDPMNYIIAVNAGVNAPTNTLPLAATSIDATTATIKNLQPGDYDIYRMCDNLYCTGGACTTNTVAGNRHQQDGFPETSKLCQQNVSVQTGITTAVDGTACNACP